MTKKWWWFVVGLLVGVAVVAGVAAYAATPVVAKPAATAVVVAKPRPIQFSNGNYVVGVESGPNHSNVIGPGTYTTDGTGGPNGLCLYRVTRNGEFVDGAFWGIHAGVKTYTFTVIVGDQLEIANGCTIRST